MRRDCSDSMIRDFGVQRGARDDEVGDCEGVDGTVVVDCLQRAAFWQLSFAFWRSIHFVRRRSRSAGFFDDDDAAFYGVVLPHFLRR